MDPFRKILFATDFSDCALHAQRYAFALAKQFGAELHIAHVVDTNYPSYAGVYGFGSEVDLHIEEVKKHAQEQLMNLTNLARQEGLDTHPHLLGGRAAEELVQKALDSQCTLIVVGTHGRSGFDHFLFGSTAERIVRFSHVPVLSVKSKEREFVTEDEDFTLNRVLCPLDLSEVAEAAVSLAAEICRRFSAELILLHVIDSRVEYPMLMPGAELPTDTQMQDHAQRKLNAIAAKHPGVNTRVEIATGIPHKYIVEAAKSEAADLVVMSTHGRTGIGRALLGSTVEKVVRTIPVPILTIRPVDTAKDGHGVTENAPQDIQPAPA